MEAQALSSSVLVSKFPDKTHSTTTTLINSIKSRNNNNQRSSSSFKINLCFPNTAAATTSSASGSRLLALARDVSGEGGLEGEEQTEGHFEHGFGSISEDNITLPQGNPDHNYTGNDVDRTSDIVTPPVVAYGSGAGGSSRTGLFRTPISGGVQSATSAHGLPRPALAVRNLMEQVCSPVHRDVSDASSTGRIPIWFTSRFCTRFDGAVENEEQSDSCDLLGAFLRDPIFSFSPLAIHTRNLLADPRCTLVVQIPGWSGLSNARVTIFGDVFPLPEDQQEWAHKQYIAKHHQGPSQQWGNFYYFRMQNISDIYFIGGFGTVAWVDVKEYETLRPDKIAVDGGEQNLKELNAIFSKPLKELLSLETEVDDVALISIDSKGTDIRVRQGAQFNIQRIPFEDGHGIETLEEAKAALWQLINRGRVYNLQK